MPDLLVMNLFLQNPVGVNEDSFNVDTPKLPDKTTEKERKKKKKKKKEDFCHHLSNGSDPSCDCNKLWTSEAKLLTEVTTNGIL